VDPRAELPAVEPGWPADVPEVSVAAGCGAVSAAVSIEYREGASPAPDVRVVLTIRLSLSQAIGAVVPPDDCAFFIEHRS
jgi:hypothetical protein